MRIRQRPSTRILYFILLWCIFSFKVLLSKVGEAGLRPDDLLLSLGLMLLLLRGDLIRIPRSRAFNAYLLFIFICLTSSVWNGLVGRVNLQYSLIFVARLIEYMSFYYLGYALLESRIDVWKGLKCYFYILCMVVPLQFTGLIPTAGLFASDRAAGNTNGPYELAAVSACFICYFSYQERRKFSAIASFVILLLTASRITFIGTLIGIGRRFVFSRTGFTKIVAVISLVLAMAVFWIGKGRIASYISENPDLPALGSRLNEGSNMLTLDYLNTLIVGAPAYTRSEDFISGVFLHTGKLSSGIKLDASGMTRAFKWTSLIKSSIASIDSLVLGLGPSFGSAAVDGYYVRVFTETGICGLLSFFAFLRILTKEKPGEPDAFNTYVMILVVTACFIDIFMSYKPMLLFWLWHGMNEFETMQGKKC